MNGLTRGSFMMNINRKESGVSQLFALISISEMCVLIHSKCTCMYPVKRGSLDSTCVWLPTASTAFCGHGIREQIEKNGVEVDTT